MANRLTQAVNPNVLASWRKCMGYGQGTAYKREPIYADAQDIIVQAQSLSKKELEHLDAMNLSDATRAIYANVQLTGVDRKAQSGGDLVTFNDGESTATWLVVHVLEGWTTSSWCKAAVAKQMDA